LKKVDNSEFTGEVSCTQIKGQNGELKAFMTDIRNISERKLLEKQIRHSERMAGIGELATGMAHEINQPLNTISLSIDNIIYSIDNKTLTNDYLKTKINKVFDNISRIKNIIDHVRTFSRDSNDFVQSEFDINNSIHSSISMIAEQMNHKGISLDFNSQDDLPRIKGNTHRLEQVMLNLLINAKDALEEKKRKFGKDFKKRIEIVVKKNNDQIIIEVKDNGIGIPAENIDKILLPFYTTKPPGHGTGLGLSISYGIIKELNGELEIQSEVLKGTTIRISIPFIYTKSKK
ncbi:MAG TPA: ATP-binding protein, partial [Prolixibacteraceae bacterium]